MKPYTVLLLYPDYLADSFGQETYQAWVEAADPAKAIRKGQVQAQRAQGPGVCPRAADFYALACFEGYLHNYAPLGTQT